MKRLFSLMLVILLLGTYMLSLFSKRVIAQEKNVDPSANVDPGDTVDVNITINGGSTQVGSSADIVLAMDTTGSMTDAFGTSTKFEAAKNAMKAFIDVSRTNVDHIALVGYAAPQGTLNGPCPGPAYDTCAHVFFPLANMTNANKDSIKAEIDNLVFNGGTSIGTGLDMASRELTNQVVPSSTSRAGVPKYIVIATDGVQNVAPSPYEVGILQQIYGENIRIFAIGVGNDVKILNPLSSNPGCSGCPTLPGLNVTSGEIIMKDIACRTDPDCNTNSSFLDTDDSTNDLGTPFQYFYADRPDELVNFYKKILTLISQKNAYQVLDRINTEVFEGIIPNSIRVTNCSGGDWLAENVIAKVNNNDTLYVVIKNVDITQNACISFRAKVRSISDTDLINCNGTPLTFAKCLENKSNFDVDGNPRIIGSWDPTQDQPTCINDDNLLTASEINTCMLEMPPGSSIIKPGNINMKAIPKANNSINVYVKRVDSFGLCTLSGSGVDGARVNLVDGVGVNVAGSPKTTDSNGNLNTPFDNLADGNYELSASDFPAGLGIVAQDVISGNAIISRPNFRFSMNSLNTSVSVIFCVGDNKGWYQTDFGDVRFNRTSNLTPLGGFGSTGGLAGNFPGVYYSSINPGNYGSGEVSPRKWKVDEEYSYTTKSQQRNGTFSYSFFTAKANKDGVSIKKVSATNSINTAVLNSLYSNPGPGGEIIEFLGSGNKVVDSQINIPANKRVVILVSNGDIEIRSNIKIGSGGLFIIAAKDNIKVNENVGVTSLDSDIASLEGFFSAEGNIIIEGSGANCNGGVPDKRLNIAGALIANAKNPFNDSLTGGKVENRRNLCVENNSQYPSLFVESMPDLILQLGDFYKTKYSKWTEEKP